jgi:hypothetical protein
MGPNELDYAIAGKPNRSLWWICPVVLVGQAVSVVGLYACAVHGISICDSDTVVFGAPCVMAWTVNAVLLSRTFSPFGAILAGAAWSAGGLWAGMILGQNIYWS